MVKSILIRNGNIVDPLSETVFTSDIRLENNKICEISKSINLGSVDIFYDAAGKMVMPGLVDLHVHVAQCHDGSQMLIKAGVTTALDASGLPDEMTSGYIASGSGLTLGYLYPLIPNKTISSENPKRSEITRVIDGALKNGALGIKILGGHYPLCPEATHKVLEIAHRHNCWVAAHAGTTVKGSDIDGFEELVKITASYPAHLAHINLYCRGMVANPLEEANRAITALNTVPKCCSESYLALINAIPGTFKDGDFTNIMIKQSLARGGYSINLKGMRKAIKDGWAQVHFHNHHKQEIELADPEHGLALYLEKNTDVFISFAINSPISSIPIALAKNQKGQFIVDALATDGGFVPRNVTLKKGLCLVEFGALKLNEFVYKACYRPAQLLGLVNKGYLSEGADADIIVVDPILKKPELVISMGQIVMQNDKVISAKGQFISLEEGKSFYNKKSIKNFIVHPDWLF